MIVKLNNLIAIRRDSIDDKLSANDICHMFNEFLVEFERMQKRRMITSTTFPDAIDDIVDAVLSILPYKLLDPKVLYHPLIYFVQQYLITILEKWRVPPIRLDIQEMNVFLKIILIFIHAGEEVSVDNNEEVQKKIKDLLIVKQFLLEVHEEIDDVILHGQPFDDDRNIYALAILAIKLLQGYPFYYKMGRNERLIDDLIMNSLDSYDFTQKMHRLQKGESLNDLEYYFLLTCCEYLSVPSSIKQKPFTQPTSIELIHYLSNELLTRFERALDQLPSIAPSSLAYIFERCDQLLNITNLPSLDKHATNTIDYLTKLLQNSSTKNTNSKALISVAFKALYNLSTIPDVRTIMRKRQLTPLLTKYTSKDMGEKRKLAFGILAQIMSEEEVNNNPTDITTFFTDQLKRLDLNGHNPHADITLSSLKVLMPYDQVKTEFVKQGGLKSVTSFIRDGNPDKQSDKQLEEALKTLWSCTLNNPEALKTLKSDTKLMARVNQLHEIAKKNENPVLEKAAEGLIWKVEKEEQFKQQQIQEAERKQQEKKRKAQEKGTEAEEEEEEEEEEQYDCMISYSWADMDLAHRIFHHLTDKRGYKVWLDQEQMHGSTIEAMANAVENAQFILMCMSDTYKRSANCQSEAEYAFNRKKHIVPLKMKADFAADGWLGFILGTRMYIDFGKHEFEKAIELLDNEIQLQKKRRKEANQLEKAARKVEAKTTNNEDEKDNEVEEQLNLNNITSWSVNVVEKFLTRKELSELSPLCSGLNGEELFDLYGMCKTSSVAMYQSLKFELLKIHEKVLPISTFLHFVNQLRGVNDNTLLSNRCVYNEYLEEHLKDDGEISLTFTK